MSAQRPATLWHYTDASGALGILVNGMLRFSDVRFLNDRTERIYGLEVVRFVLSHEARREDTLGILRATIEYLTESAQPDDVHVCSLSGTSETIGQWQRYGADGYGYCIGFDAKTLSLCAASSPPILLRQIDYNRTSQMKAVLGVIREARFAWSVAKAQADATVPRGTFVVTHAVHLARALTLLSLQFKNPAFEDEAEWRLIVAASEHQLGYMNVDIAFALRGAYVKPFIDLPPVADKVLGRPDLPVQAIICGPRLQKDLAVSRMAYFLKRLHYSYVPVEYSSLAMSWR